MFAVISCITVQHDLSLVALAGLLCAFGSWVTSRLYRHARQRRGGNTLSWHALAASIAGVSAWGTHFVAMLGFRPAVPVSFDLTLTFVSLVIAVAGSAVAFAVPALSRWRGAAAVGGAVLGLSFAAMHYTGMIAYRVQGIIYWDRTYLVASILIAMILPAFALHVGSMARRWKGEKMAGLLTLGIVSLHFTGMTAFQVSPLDISGDYINPESLKVLGMMIAGTAALVILGGLSSYVVEKRTRLENIAELIAARNAAEQASRAKSEFISVLSHELRTPLTVVLGYATLLSSIKTSYSAEGEPVSPEDNPHFHALGSQAELYGDRVATAGSHLLTLINDILDYTGMELKEVELNRSAMPLAGVLEDARTQFAEQAMAKGVDVRIDCANIVIEADRGRILQIVNNLLGNALKFSQAKTVILRGRRYGNDVRIEVEDTGKGIPEDRLASIFDAFSLAETADHRSEGGTGLGLAICRKLAVSHGGDIRARSVVGSGSVFTVSLPDCIAETDLRLVKAA
ncbi:ATPase [Oceanicola sp. 22II-s10i]|uniref:sensor histidine kinase n=1 Tax=Oceanicola sp. 22II-s10i TaxID=1317116 RepID=UPI000B6B82BB|nr:MHYT domain-containing protein [Oceanicola sp. 22II-s10i]OWU84949.1 ATPase [Oceanicola sp. 22II-s10i]